MSAQARDKKAAFAVMQHLTGPAAGVIMAVEGRQTAARREVYDDPQVREDTVLAVFREQLAHTVPMPNTPAMRMVWSPATVMMNKVINGKVAPADAARQAQAEVTQLLKGARR
jgi:maltose-binding protein MalE